MFGIDWDLDGDIDIIDDLMTLELLSEEDEEEQDGIDKQIFIVALLKFTYNRIEIR